jgi:ATP-dependent DNA helicase RecG
MSPEHLAEIASHGESEVLEFKESTGQRTEAAKTICAMLNHRGGRVLFGVSPDRRIVGQTLSDRSIEDVAGEIRQIDPPALPTIDRVLLSSGREVLVVGVGTGRSKPYMVRGKCYRRIGNTNRLLSSEEYNALLMERLHADQRWEIEEAVGVDAAALDTSALVFSVEEAIRRGRISDPGTRDPELLLRGLGLMREGRILKAAVALFGIGSDMQRDFPQFLLRVARFRGVDRTEFIDNRQFHGNIFTLLGEAERFLLSSLPVAGRVASGSIERVDYPLFPFAALREALANAFCHRDYSIGGGSVGIALYDDRLEITSAGALHFGLTPEALFQDHESLPWNPLVARVMYLRGIIEQWGRGTLKMAELMEGAGLPRPDIDARAGSVVVTFRATGYAAPTRVSQNLTDRQRRILELLAGEKWGLSRSHFRRELNPSPRDWELGEDLTYLRQLGLIRTSGHARGAKWFLV